MGQLLVRGLNDAVIEGLRRRAARSGRSVEAEHRAILQEAVADDVESFEAASARLQARMPRLAGDSADIIREYRDRNWKEE